MKTRLLLIAALIAAAGAMFAADGKWTPQQMLEIDPAFLKEQGLEIEPSKLWDAKRGTGLLAATVNISGCSAGLISPEGLFITNHHCLFGMLQEHATPENDIITNGFIASGRTAELPGKVMRAAIPRSFTDVTAEVLAAVPAKATDVQRYKAIEKKQKELVDACEKRPATRCRVASFDGGVQYILVDSIEFQDVRLVYAPPRAVGEYGGEVDNWMWPRHTGDFAMARIYTAPDGTSAPYSTANVPLKSEFYFPISTKGVKPGDFIMVLGYPGITYRSLTAEEMSERRDFFFARRERIYREWIDLMEAAAKGNPAGEIAVADEVKSLANRQKNAAGQLEGFRRGSLLEKQRVSDEAVMAWALKQPDNRAVTEAYKGLAAMATEQRASFDHDFLLNHAVPTAGSPNPSGPKALTLAATVVRSALERAKPEADRDSLYSPRNIGRQRDRLERAQKSIFRPADDAVFASWAKHALALAPQQRITAVDKAFEGATAPDAIRKRVEELSNGSRIFDVTERLKMFDETVEQLRARKDPLIDLALALEPERLALNEKQERWSGTVSRLRPVWRKAVIAQAGKPVAPDANSTLRFTFGHVRGYEPRDGVFYKPQTTLAGVVAKHTGEEPFDAPKAVLDAAAAKKFGPWADPLLRDVPVNFLGDADTTGGNSGSPTINGRGELVGVNFDRVWENVANDFGYNPDIARNVNVDIRYMLWLIDQVSGAEPLMKELGLR